MVKDCDLLARIRWIVDAVSTMDVGVNPLTSYYIHEGVLHASDGRMVAATPFPFEGTVLVPAAPFLKVLSNRPDGDFEWEREDDRLVLHRGRFRGKVKVMDPSSWIWPIKPPNALPIPADFIPSLEAVLPFCSENATKPWATCILLAADALYASNNVVVARARCAGMQIAGEYLLPRWVAEFVTKRSEGLVAWELGESQVGFTWEDGSWMRSALINDKFPPVGQVLATFHPDGDDLCTTAITDEWRRAVRRVAKITDDPVVRLRMDGVYGASGEVVHVEDDASTPCPDGLSETVWDIRFLEDVIQHAHHWNPTTYPNPAPFRGTRVDGIIIGRRD